MASPWGVWCEFVWIFCSAVAVLMDVMEAKRWHTFLPNWADLTCGLTTVCAVMMTSNTIIFVAVFFHLSCIVSILCFICSLVASVVFLIDTVTQRQTFPSGYLCSLRGGLRTSEAFIACIILTAATDHFVNAEWLYPHFWMISSIAAFAIFLLVTVVIIVLNLLKELQYPVPFRLSLMEFVLNIVAVLMYLLASLLWSVFGYRWHRYNSFICHQRCSADINTVIIGANVNLVLYIVDMILSCKSC